MNTDEKKDGAPARLPPPHECFWLATLALLYLVQTSSFWYAAPDAGGYLSLARSLARNHWPTNLGRAQLYYSPGYPLLVSPAFVLADYPFLLLSLFNFALALLFIAGVYVWARRNVPAAALLVTALVMVNVDVLGLYRRTLSETAFMPVLMWTVNALEARARQPGAGKLQFLAGIALMMLLASIRQAGILVAVAFAVRMAIEARHGTITWRRALLSVLAVGVPAALVLVILAGYDQAMAARAGSFTYLQQIIDDQTSLAGQLAEGLRLRVSEVGRLLLPGMFKVYGRTWWNPIMLLYVPAFLIVLVGWWRMLRARLDLLALLLPFYLALYIVWPYDQGTRFFAPLLPLLAVCLWFFLEPFARYRRRLFLGLCVAHAAFAVGFWLFVDRPLARHNDQYWPIVQKLAATVRQESGAVVTINTPSAFSLFLQYEIDRPVHEVSAGKAVTQDVRWVVMPARDPGLADFNPLATAGAFQLLVRK